MLSLFETIVKLGSRGPKADAGFAVSANSLEFVPGTHWKHLVIRTALGKGHFGTVYRAYDTHLNREVALKFLDSAQALYEGKLLARIHHDNIVKVHSIEQHGDLTAICMELVEGTDLESYVAHKGCLDPVHTAVVGRQIADALATVHRAGLLHRDIKAQNVVMTTDGHIVLVDFGLGVPSGGGAGEFAGTLPYMAPELFEGAPPSRNTDLYALGVLLFHLVSREYPVMAPSVEDLLKLHRAGDRLHLADCASIPEAFGKVVERAVAANPSDRFQSAGAMVTALDEVIRTRRALPRLRVPPKAMWAAAVVGTVLAGAWMFRDRWPRAPEPTLELLESQTGVYYEPSLSADGRVLVFSSDKAGNGDLDVWVKHINTGYSKALTGPGADEVEPSVSPDGTLVAYRSERDGGLYLNSTLGGEERRVASDGHHPRFSPDGRSLAYWTGEAGNLHRASARTYIILVSGGEPTPVLQNFADCRLPVWSPDGKSLLVSATPAGAPPVEAMDWWLVLIKEPASPVKLNFYPRVRQSKMTLEEYPPHWAGNRVVFAARHGETRNIWQVGLAQGRLTGDIERITSGTAAESDPWTLADGTVAFAAVNHNLNIWSAELGTGYPKLTRETSAVTFDLTPHVSSDGRTLLFTRMKGQARWTWLRNRVTGAERQLPLPDRATSVLSPDGTGVAYSRESAGNQALMYFRPDSGATKVVCDDCGAPLDWSADGTHVLYISRDAQAIGVLDLVSASRIVLVRPAGRLFMGAALSPNQDRLALVERVDSEASRIRIVRVVSWRAEPEELWTDITSGRGFRDKPAWSADGRTLYYDSNDDAFGCVWAQRFDEQGQASGKPQSVLHLHSARLSSRIIAQRSFNLSFGGGRLFINLDELSSTLWLRRPRPLETEVINH
jgi:Tol biopolymer transport system component